MYGSEYAKKQVCNLLAEICFNEPHGASAGIVFRVDGGEFR